MAILVLFEEFSAKFCFNFLTLILSASPNMMHFVRAFSICACLRLIAIEEARNYEKIISYIKNIFQNDWWEEAYPSSYPPPFRSAPGPKLQTLSKESGIFQSHGTINFVVFLLKDKVKRRGPGVTAQRPP